MSTFKHNKGKLVEQPIRGMPFKIICIKAYEFEDREFKVGDISYNSWGHNVPDNWQKVPLREYIAEGNFVEDELVEEKDLGLCYQWCVNAKWLNCDKETYDSAYSTLRRIIARKVTKEEGEKPEAGKVIEFDPIGCDHRLKNGLSAWEFLHEASGNVGQQESLFVCLKCGDFKVFGRCAENTNHFNYEGHIIIKRTLAAMIRQAAYMNEQTTDEFFDDLKKSVNALKRIWPDKPNNLT